jgi:hypothetical protein
VTDGLLGIPNSSPQASNPDRRNVLEHIIMNSGQSNSNHVAPTTLAKKRLSCTFCRRRKVSIIPRRICHLWV